MPESGFWGNNDMIIEFNQTFWQHYLNCNAELTYNAVSLQKVDTLLDEFLQKVQLLEF